MLQPKTTRHPAHAVTRRDKRGDASRTPPPYGIHLADRSSPTGSAAVHPGPRASPVAPQPAAPSPAHAVVPAVTARVSDPRDASEREAVRLARSVAPTRSRRRRRGEPRPGGPAGRPLDPAVRATLESALGSDLSAVRVHDGAAAAAAARSLGARALTRGRDIWLGAGESDLDVALMAHEAVHVVQQTGLASTVVAVHAPDELVQGAWYNPLSWVEDVDWVWKKLGAAVAALPGYRLLTFVLGIDPISRTPVARTVATLLGGLSGLVPGLEDPDVADAAATDATRLLAKLTAIFAARGLSLDALHDRIAAITEQLADGEALDAVGELRSFLTATLTSLRQSIAESADVLLADVLRLVTERLGPAGKRFADWLAQTGGLVVRIVKDPGLVLGQLANALRKGFGAFSQNFVQYLKDGLFKWLSGALGAAALPKKLDLPEIVGFIADLLGLTWEKVKRSLIARIHEHTGRPMAEVAAAVGAVERGVRTLADLLTHGPQALLDALTGKAAEFLATATAQLRAWLARKIVGEGVQKLLAAVVPGAGFIKAIEAIYNATRFCIDRADQFQALVDRIARSVARLADGDIDGTAEAIHQSLRHGLELALGFLANIALGPAIHEQIEALRKHVEALIDRAIDALVPLAMQAFTRARTIGAAVGARLSQWFTRLEFPIDKGEHTLQFDPDSERDPLTIHSTPRTLRAWIEANKQRLGVATAAKISAVCDRIDGLKWKLVSDNQKTEPLHRTKKRARQIQLIIETELVPLLVLSSPGDLPESVIRYSEFRTVKIGDSWQRISGKMEANPLTLRGQPGHARTEPAIWDALLMKQHPKKYVRGHLLNHEVHGKGDRENLVPITGKFNSLMERTYEDRVKRAVLGELKIVAYTVKLIFGRHEHSDKLSQEELPLPVAFFFKAATLERDKNGEYKTNTVLFKATESHDPSR